MKEFNLHLNFRISDDETNIWLSDENGGSGIEVSSSTPQAAIKYLQDYLLDYCIDNNKSEENDFIIITWPDSQGLFDLEGFEENCHLINDEIGLEKFGPSAYFVNKQWYESEL
jgi:hypothetical protein